MTEKSKSSVAIIGGADGPTSIFIAGRTGKKSLKNRVQNYIYKCKCKRAEKKISAGSHTFEEVVAYAIDKYDLMEVNTSQGKYTELKKNIKEYMVIRHKPELLGDLKDISKPDFQNEDSIRKFYEQIEARSEMIAQIPDSEMPMDFHIYQLKKDEGSLEMKIDYIWNFFSVSYSGNKKSMKQFKKIGQDLYLYYGVDEADIKTKSERYSSLLAALSV